MHTSGAPRRENADVYLNVSTSLRAQRSNPSFFLVAAMDCFVASAPLRKRFAFVAGNDG
jgi:hypothetical protein